MSFAEFDAFCEATGRNAIEDDFGRGKQPVINVSWHDAVAYCQWLSTMNGQDYCLPSEARWEYACRAGTTTPWNTGTKLGTDQANFYKTHSGTFPVDQYAPNDFALYQMHGNVWEWCQDSWQDDYKGAPTDGSAKDSRSNSNARALRGGSWFFDDYYCRSSFRNNNHPDNRNNNIGFRVSCLSHIIGRIPLDQRANAGNSLRPRLQRRGTALQSLTQVLKPGSIMPVAQIAGD